jgi:hypothetical protein
MARFFDNLAPFADIGHWQARRAVDAVPFGVLAVQLCLSALLGSERLRQPRGFQTRESQFNSGHSRSMESWQSQAYCGVLLRRFGIVRHRFKSCTLRCGRHPAG